MNGHQICKKIERELGLIVRPHTLRRWERVGLLPTLNRKPSLHREYRYHWKDVKRLATLRVGYSFTEDEVRAVMAGDKGQLSELIRRSELYESRLKNVVKEILFIYGRE